MHTPCYLTATVLAALKIQAPPPRTGTATRRPPPAAAPGRRLLGHRRPSPPAAVAASVARPLAPSTIGIYRLVKK